MKMRQVIILTGKRWEASHHIADAEFDYRLTKETYRNPDPLMVRNLAQAGPPIFHRWICDMMFQNQLILILGHN